MTYDDQARADLCRFLAACYYEPGPEFAEERLFDSMLAVAGAVDKDLARNVERLGAAFSADSLQDLLVDYTRLFLGPTDILAKPYGSSWMAGEKKLMQDSTMAVLALYAEGGFEMDEAFRELPDHIAAELEFLYLLNHRLAAARQEGDTGALQITQTLRQRLLQDHLGRWVHPFTRAVHECARTGFYRELAQITERTVAGEVACVE